MNIANFTPEELKLEISLAEDEVRELELKLAEARQYVEGLKVARMIYEGSLRNESLPTSPSKATYN